MNLRTGIRRRMLRLGLIMGELDSIKFSPRYPGEFKMFKSNYEIELKPFFDKLSMGKTFFDLGANIGCYSFRLAKRGCKVVAVEAERSNYKRLVVGMYANNLDFITLNALVWSELGEQVKLNKSKYSPLTHSAFKMDGKKVYVNTTTIDELTARYGKPDLIKLDIEGSEYQALLGGIKTITKYKPSLIIEVWENHNTTKVFEILSRYYRIHNIYVGNTRHIVTLGEANY